jgi:GntR family transcriptional regulator
LTNWRKDNLLIRRQGKGTFVATHAEQQVQYRFLKLKPDHGDLNSQGPAATIQIIDCKRTESANNDVAKALRFAPVATRCCNCGRVLSFGAVSPSFMEDIWLPGCALSKA